MKKEHKFSSRIARRFFFKNIILYTIFSILFFVLVGVLSEGFSISEIISFMSEKLFLLLFLPLVLWIPVLIFFEQLHYSVNRKLIVSESDFQYYIGGEKVLEFKLNDIQQYIIFGETTGYYFFAVVGAKFGVMRLKENYEVILPGFMCENLKELAPFKAQKERMAIPSIFYYDSFLSNNAY